MIAALFGSVATATDLYLCADVDVDYTDYDGGDRWIAGNDQNAVGFDALVWNTTTDTQVWPSTSFTYAPLDSDGCTPAINATSGHQYYLLVRSSATVGSHTINVWDDITTPALASAMPVIYTMGNYPVSVSGTLPGSTERRWNHLALARTAVHLHDGLMSGQTIDFYHFLSIGSCYYNNVDDYIATNTTCMKKKFVLAHELGHLIAFHSDTLDGTATGLGDTSSVDEGCNGGGALRKAFARFAFEEAFADWYAAITWNIVNQGDCEWTRDQDHDFNIDTTIDKAAGFPVKCYGDPINGITPNPGTHDWLEQMVTAGAGSCTGQLRNRATKFDLGRYFWALLVDQGLGIADVFQVWDTFDIRSTDPDDNGDTGDVGGNLAGSDGTEDDPMVRWKEAMDDEGFLVEHEAERDHGLDHDPDAL